MPPSLQLSFPSILPTIIKKQQRKKVDIKIGDTGCYNLGSDKNKLIKIDLSIVLTIKVTIRLKQMDVENFSIKNG